jgi:hypothetical protein
MQHAVKRYSYEKVRTENMLREEWRSPEDAFFQAARVTCYRCGWVETFKGIKESQMRFYGHAVLCK